MHVIWCYCPAQLFHGREGRQALRHTHNMSMYTYTLNSVHTMILLIYCDSNSFSPPSPSLPYSKTRSHSISGAEHFRLRKQNHALVTFPAQSRSENPSPVNTVRDTTPSSAARSRTKSHSASPSPHHSGSLCRLNQNTESCGSPALPDHENTPTFFRCRPQRPAPNPRPRRTLSLYEQGNMATLSYPTHNHSHSNPHSHSQTPPSPSPPLPKRSQRSLSSLSELPTTPTTVRTFAAAAAGVRNGWSNGSNPAIITSASSPHAGSVPSSNPFSSSSPGNLDNCLNFSSSALHPVTLNATNAPQQQQTRNGRRSSVSSLNASPTSLPRQLSNSSTGGGGRSQLSPSSSRKVSSAASASPSGSTNWTNDIEDEVRRARQRFPSCDGLIGADTPGGHTVFPALDCSSPGDSTRKKHDGSPTPPFGSALPNLPSPIPSPSVLHRFSPTLDSYREETDGAGGSGGDRDSDVIEVFPSRDGTDNAGCTSPSPIPLPSRPRNMRFYSETHVDDMTLEPHTLSSPSPTSSRTSNGTSESHHSQEHNGIFIEFQAPTQRVPPGLPSSVTHPYASWAVTQQDAENLRQLVQFPWFHGMISRANATQLVLADGEAGSGRYLVRQSESREGEFVLTFNYRGRAKHLRIVLDSTGCSVQHLYFNAVSNMLDYFKNHTIPLETCWSEDDCRITDYIDRSVSDSIRTITAIYNNELLSSPRLPRRSHSLHLALTQAVMSAMHQQHGGGASSPGSRGNLPGERGGRVRRGSSSLPHNAHHHTGGGGGSSGGGGGGGWRNIFWPNRSSTLQRRHSEMSDIHHTIDNNYTLRY